MHFPSNGGGRPYVRIDGHSGSFKLSVPEGGDPEIIDMSGKLLDLDLSGAVQGWLRYDVGGADWLVLETLDDWASTPKPSADHAPGVSIDVMCRDWPEPKVRQLRGSSRAITSFIARVSDGAGKIPNDKVARIRLTGAKALKFGKGSSVDIGFDIAPKDAWPNVEVFDEHRGAQNETNGAASSFEDMEDSPLDGAGSAADDWQ